MKTFYEYVGLLTIFFICVIILVYIEKAVVILAVKDGIFCGDGDEKVECMSLEQWIGKFNSYPTK